MQLEPFSLDTDMITIQTTKDLVLSLEESSDILGEHILERLMRHELRPPDIRAFRRLILDVRELLAIRANRR